MCIQASGRLFVNWSCLGKFRRMYRRLGGYVPMCSHPGSDWSTPARVWVVQLPPGSGMARRWPRIADLATTQSTLLGLAANFADFSTRLPLPITAPPTAGFVSLPVDRLSNELWASPAVGIVARVPDLPHDRLSGPDDPGPRSGLLAQVSTEMVQAMKEYHGKGPISANSYLIDDLLFVVLREGMTRSEQTMFDAGHEDAVRIFARSSRTRWPSD